MIDSSHVAYDACIHFLTFYFRFKLSWLLFYNFKNTLLSLALYLLLYTCTTVEYSIADNKIKGPACLSY
jgi:hypothetical protein